jgi:Fanconi anemia group M protein
MPFINPFSKQKKKSRNLKIIPTIIADIHEKNSLVISELKSSKQINLDIKHLKIGDYLIGKTIIERKTTSDFISSMINKRLIQQLKQMQKYKQQILIIEGKQKNLYEFSNPNAIRGFIISILTNYQIPIIFTNNSKDTAQYLIALAKQQLKKPIESSLHSRIPKKIKEQKQYILEAFPGIGPATSKKLLKEFKTLAKTLNATTEDLEKILRKKAKDFKKLFEG